MKFLFASLATLSGSHPALVPTADEARRHQIRNRWLAFALAIATIVLLALSPNAAAASVVGVGMVGFGGMILDAQALLSDAQALTGTALSTNTYDLGAAGNDVGIGEPLCAVVTVDVAADATTGDETYRFSVIQSANANLSSSDELLTTNVTFVTRAFLSAGRKLILPIPPGLLTKRFIGLNYTLGGTTPLITVTAAILPMSMVQNEKAYADGFTISS